MKNLNNAAFKLVAFMGVLAILMIFFLASQAYAQKNMSIFSCGDFFLATDKRIPMQILPKDANCTQFQIDVLDDFPTGLQQKPSNCLDDVWLCSAFYYISLQPPVKPLVRCGFWSVQGLSPEKCDWDHSE